MGEPPMRTLEDIARFLRHYSIRATTEAGSGHATSSLSAADLMAVLVFGGSGRDAFFHFDLERPDRASNDRLIFSKGHASPLYYALWLAADAITEEKFLAFRKFSELGADMQGHPTVEFKFAEATTGSLGQGLSIGVGMALSAKLDVSDSRTFVLLGDSEMAEGSVWEAMSVASYYKLGNLVAIADVNRLGQRGETMHGHDTSAYAAKARAFGWHAIEIDGHSLEAIRSAYAEALGIQDKPVIIVAKTYKGRGVSMLEDKDNWHGKPLSREDTEKALAELGPVDPRLRAKIAMPSAREPKAGAATTAQLTDYPKDKAVATRRAYGNALVHLGAANPDVVVLDAETSNSTYSEFFKAKFPDRFFEMFIAEQNMAGVAQGFSRRGKLPFASTFAAFLTRAFDQIRMGAYSASNVTFCGSHAGVSIGEDGVSQMGLEDIAMFRAVFGSTVVYPSDAVSTEKLVHELAKTPGTCYIRTTRKDTPILYGNEEHFPLGGSKTLRHSKDDVATVIAAGITLHETLKAADELKAKGTNIRVIDLYSVKPLDIETLRTAALDTGALITVEDHYESGGIGEAVASALSDEGVCCRITRLAVRKMAKSGKPDELLAYEGIDSKAIVEAVQGITDTG